MSGKSDEARSHEASGARDAFAHVRDWVFDLDNTLYSARHRLFDQIDQRMTAFIAETLSLEVEAANTLRAVYWREHGTTLNGLMREHGMKPARFLDYVHDIDLSAVPEDPALGAAIERLPGRKIVYTNGSRGHAARILAHLGIEAAFDAVFGIEDSAYEPKPRRAAYDRVFSLAAVEPRRAAMVEDTARNLEAPHEMGMVTVWTPTECGLARDGADGAHVHFIAEDLAAFLRPLGGGGASANRR
ncbi:MAG: pyrimidine 5'-nucleotidase [Pseudomonadota bacterium]